MNNTQLISENYIKNNSPVTTNVDPKDLFPHVISAQQMYLRVFLGAEFMEDLQVKYANQTLNADEIELVQNYIQPYLLYKALQLALPFMQYNLRNKGLMVNSDDSATPAGFPEFKYMLNEVKGRSDTNELLLRKYLETDGKKYPLYKQSGLGGECKLTVDSSQGLIFY